MHTISDSIRCSRTPDGSILLDVRQGQVFRLNVLGSKILELLQEGSSEEEIVHQISGSYDVDIDTVRIDLRNFFKALSQNKILLAQDPTERTDTRANDVT